MFSSSNIKLLFACTANPSIQQRRPVATVRPFLLRRGTATNPTGGSFKRRSLKLRRNTKDGKDIEADCEFGWRGESLKNLNCDQLQMLSNEQTPFSRDGKFRRSQTAAIIRNRLPVAGKKNLRAFSVTINRQTLPMTRTTQTRRRRTSRGCAR